MVLSLHARFLYWKTWVLSQNLLLPSCTALEQLWVLCDPQLLISFYAAAVTNELIEQHSLAQMGPGMQGLFS